MEFHAGVIAALKIEIAQARKEAGGGPLVFAVSGVGPGNAAKTAREMVRRHDPHSLISAGFCGALRNELPTGTIVLGGSDAHMLRLAHEAAPEAVLGEVVSVDEVVRESEEKKRLQRETGAAVVDMEAKAVEEVAAESGKGFLFVKAVLDTLEDPLASTYKSLPAVLGQILTRPRTLPGIRRDARRARLCVERLGAFFSALAIRL